MRRGANQPVAVGTGAWRIAATHRTSNCSAVGASRRGRFADGLKHSTWGNVEAWRLIATGDAANLRSFDEGVNLSDCA